MRSCHHLCTIHQKPVDGRSRLSLSLSLSRTSAKRNLLVFCFSICVLFSKLNLSLALLAPPPPLPSFASHLYNYIGNNLKCTAYYYIQPTYPPIQSNPISRTPWRPQELGISKCKGWRHGGKSGRRQESAKVWRRSENRTSRRTPGLRPRPTPTVRMRI